MRKTSEIALLLFLLHTSRLIVVDGAALPLGGGREEHFLDHLGQRGGRALNRTGRGITAEGLDPDRSTTFSPGRSARSDSRRRSFIIPSAAAHKMGYPTKSWRNVRLARA
jgi:hypothetical protein